MRKISGIILLHEIYAPFALQAIGDKICYTVQDLLQPGTHGTTFGGNPLACAVSNAIFDVIEREGLEDHVRQVGSGKSVYISRKMTCFPCADR
jgi:acetylornithine/succinyldiaminopimelate/putrescine aminotransferase